MSIELVLALTAAVAVMEFCLLCYCLVDCYWPEQEDKQVMKDMSARDRFQEAINKARLTNRDRPSQLDPDEHSLDEALIRVDTLTTQVKQRDHEITLCRAEISRLRVIEQTLRSVIPKENQ